MGEKERKLIFYSKNLNTQGSFLSVKQRGEPREDTLKDIYDKISILKTDLKPFNTEVNQERNATWVQPKYVCEVNYTEWTEEGHLRHPVFKGLRIDKDPTEVVKEEKVEIR